MNEGQPEPIAVFEDVPTQILVDPPVKKAPPNEPAGYHQVDVKTLPSQGYLYPGVTQIPIRIWSVDDVDRIGAAGDDDSQMDRALAAALARNIQFPIDDLSLGDMIYLLLWERVNAYGADYKLSFYCGETQGETSTIYDLRTMEQKKLTDLYLKHAQDHEYKLTLGADTVQIDIIRRRDYIARDAYLALFRGRTKASDTLIAYASAIKTVNGNAWELGRKVGWLQSLSPKIYKRIEAFHELFYHGLNFSDGAADQTPIKVRCPNWRKNGVCPNCTCQKDDAGAEFGERLLRLPFRIDLLIPRGSETCDLESEISGNAGV